MGMYYRSRPQQSRDADGLAESLLALRTGTRTGVGVAVNNDSAMRHSGVWACLRLRANLLSTMPVDVYRNVLGIAVEMKKPLVLVEPGGSTVDITEWLYSTQVDLDRAGNTVGLITERDGNGLPSRIDLQAISEVTMVIRDGGIRKFKVGRKEYDPTEVWHEKQYTVAGLPYGLSPVAYSAWTIGEYLAIGDYATKWFKDGGKPSAVLKNTKATLDKDATATVKAEFNQTTANGDVFVTGKDWEYSPLATQVATMEWLGAKQYSVGDVARFFDCPGDLIDAVVSGSTITYANVVQRNLQFLIMHLGPAIIRREHALSKLTARPRFVKLNRGAILAMDPKTQAEVLGLQIDKRLLTPSEGRDYYDLPPMTQEQIDEVDHFFPPKGASAPAGATPKPQPNQGAV